MLYRIEDYDSEHGLFWGDEYFDLRCTSEGHEHQILVDLAENHDTTHGATEKHRDSDQGHRMYKHFFKSEFYLENKEALDLLLNSCENLTLITVDEREYSYADTIYEDEAQVCVLVD